MSWHLRDTKCMHLDHGKRADLGLTNERYHPPPIFLGTRQKHFSHHLASLRAPQDGSELLCNLDPAISLSQGQARQIWGGAEGRSFPTLLFMYLSLGLCRIWSLPSQGIMTKSDRLLALKDDINTCVSLLAWVSLVISDLLSLLGCAFAYKRRQMMRCLAQAR